MEELEVVPLSCLPHTSHPTSRVQGEQTAPVAVFLSGSIHTVICTYVSVLPGALQLPQTAETLKYEKLRWEVQTYRANPPVSFIIVWLC